jgi:DNA polymerase-1
MNGGKTMKSHSKKMIALDADYLIFECTEGKFTQNKHFGSEEGEVEGEKYKEPLKPFKVKFKRLVSDVENEIAANLPGEVKGIKVIISAPDGNFRYKIYPEYKANRKSGSRSELFYRLRKWVIKKYGYVKDVEADDVVAYYVREKGWIGASFDKDLLRGVPGVWFDTYHARRNLNTTSEGEARNFNLIQNLSGDPTDNIKGIPGVAEKTAIKLLDKHGWDWGGVVAAYKEKGLTIEDAILNRRLICMNQWTPKKGVKLWKPKKN